MAADSRETNRMNGRADIFNYKSKVRNYKNVFYAVAGYPSIWKTTDRSIIFSAYDMFENALGKFGNIDSSISYFKKNSTTYLDSLFKDNPTQTAGIYTENSVHLFMDVAVVKFIENKKQTFFFTYYIDFNSLTKLFNIRIKDKYYNTNAYIHKMGVYDHINDTLNSSIGTKKFQWDTERTNEILNSLIELEKRHHIEVGGTVDVVLIYNNGYKWFSNNKY